MPCSRFGKLNGLLLSLDCPLHQSSSQFRRQRFKRLVKTVARAVRFPKTAFSVSHGVRQSPESHPPSPAPALEQLGARAVLRGEAVPPGDRSVALLETRASIHCGSPASLLVLRAAAHHPTFCLDRVSRPWANYLTNSVVGSVVKRPSMRKRSDPSLTMHRALRC